ncbi:MAG: cytochrome P450/oxidoreductase [Burkholderiaceae bacterium]
MSTVPSAESAVPVYAPDIFDDAAILDPMPHYAAIRELGPVVWLPAQGVYAVGRYAEVTRVLRDPLTFVSSKGLSLQPKVNDILVGSTLNSDPPAHDATRAVTGAPLLPGALGEHAQRIENAAERLIESLVERGSFDAIADLAQYLPVTIVAELVGLPDAGRGRLFAWASATFNLFGPDNARARAAFADLKELRAFLEVYGKPGKLKEGGWADRIFRVGPQRGIALETCAQLMRDYINPSLDTTISATGQAIALFAENPDQWDLLRARPELTDNAIEEVVRLSTPIRALSRHAIRDAEIAGVPIPAGSRLLVIYASANRDPRKYADPDRFDVRRDVHDHVGFGHGVHMCMGMHLARLEIRCLLRALARRVERFEFAGEPTIAMNNTIRAFATLPVRVVPLAAAPGRIGDAAVADPLAGHALVRTAGALAGERQDDPHWLQAVVCERRLLTPDIVELTLESTTDAVLPPFTAGAHIDLEAAPGLVRQYSLTGDPGVAGRYRLGILRERDGLVSPRVHDELVAGRLVRISRPRNHFALNEEARRTLLFAGGIGLTPLLAMAFRLRSLGRPFHLHVRARDVRALPFASELASLAPDVTVSTSADAPSGAFNYDRDLACPAADDHLYICGPARFMAFVQASASAAGWTDGQVHAEHFGAEIDTEGEPFEVVCARSGRILSIAAGRTIASTLLEAGIDVPMSCQSGVCGTCLTRVIEGRPDHRDLVQTEAEKARNERITVCCSRSLSRRLVLDI